MSMTFYRSNFVNTTTMLTVTTGSTTVANVFDRKYDTQYASSGDASDATTTTLGIVFTTSKNISAIVLENINVKGFRVYYNSNTANTFTLLNGDTTVSYWSQNSCTSMMLMFATVSVDSVCIDMSTTIIANSEKKVGEVWVLEKYHEFTYNPDSAGYDPSFYRKEYKHEMSDGGIVTYFIQDNYRAKVKRKYVDPSEYATLLAMYRLYDTLTFVPFPTGTSDWDETIYAVNWVGDFDFAYTTNVPDNGYSGTINIQEIPR